MEIDMITLGVTDARRRTTILDKATLLDKGIRILDLDRFMWIQTKNIYDKHVERLKIGKTLMKRKNGLKKQGLSFYFL
jgi:hypothetical protein